MDDPTRTTPPARGPNAAMHAAMRALQRRAVLAWLLFLFGCAAAIARAWSLVHGFTMLTLDGRLEDILHRLPAGNNVGSLLDAMLKVALAKPPA